MYKFFLNAYFEDDGIESKLNIYDEDYFSKNALLFFTATSDRMYDAAITSVKVKNKELFVTLTRKPNGNQSEYFFSKLYYRFEIGYRIGNKVFVCYRK